MSVKVVQVKKYIEWTNILYVVSWDTENIPVSLLGVSVKAQESRLRCLWTEVMYDLKVELSKQESVVHEVWGWTDFRFCSGVSDWKMKYDKNLV